MNTSHTYLLAEEYSKAIDAAVNGMADAIATGKEINEAAEALVDAICLYIGFSERIITMLQSSPDKYVLARFVCLIKIFAWVKSHSVFSSRPNERSCTRTLLNFLDGEPDLARKYEDEIYGIQLDENAAAIPANAVSGVYGAPKDMFENNRQKRLVALKIKIEDDIGALCSKQIGKTQRSNQ